MAARRAGVVSVATSRTDSDGNIDLSAIGGVRRTVVTDSLSPLSDPGRLPARGVISPCLSNVFLHHVLDESFEIEVKPRLRGERTLVRYADDALMEFDNILDAKRVLSVPVAIRSTATDVLLTLSIVGRGSYAGRRKSAR